MFMYRWQILTLAFLGCGVEVGNPRNPKDDGNSTKYPVEPNTIVTQDSEAALHIVTGQIDEVIDAVAADDSTASVSSSLALVDIEHSRTCSESEGNAVVTKSMSGDREVERGAGPLVRKVYRADVSVNKTVTWSIEGSSVACNDAGTNVAISWREVESVSRQVSLSRRKTATITRKINDKLLRTTQFSSEGSRRFVWQRMESEDESLRRVRGEFTTEVNRSLALTTARGGSFDAEESVVTADGSPLVIEAYYDVSTGDLARKVIESGQVIATQKDEALVKTTYDRVVLKPGNGCQPESGTISGEIFENATITEPSLTYTVEFSEDGAVVRFSTGEVEEYEADSCQFEE